jgi:hypothetical protein
MSFWGKIFGGARSSGTSADTLFQQNMIAAAAMYMTLHQYKPPPQMQHVSYEDQAADFLKAGLRGDTKAQKILIEMIAYFPEQLLADPLDEVIMRQLMHHALNGDQAAQKRVAALLQTLVRNEEPEEPDMTLEQKALWQRDQHFVCLAESQLSQIAPSMYQQAGRGFFLFDEREHSLETQGTRDIGYWGISEIIELPISKGEGDIIRACVATYLVESQFVVVILRTDVSISVHQCNYTLPN